MTDYKESATRTTVSRSTWQKLNDRKVIQWTVGYVLASWLLLKILALFAGTFGFSQATLTRLSYLLASGVFPLLVVRWCHGGEGRHQVSGTEAILLAAYVVVLAIAALQQTNRVDSAASLYDLTSFSMEVVTLDPPEDAVLTEEHFDPALEVAVAVEYRFYPPLSELPLVDDLTIDLGVIYDENPTSLRTMQLDSKSVRVDPLETTLHARIDRGMIRGNALKLHVAAQMRKRDGSLRIVGTPVRIEYPFQEPASK
jgi:hypothetical protein